MEKEIIEIIKQKDDYAFVVEISETAKGDTQISVKVRTDSDVKDAGKKLLRREIKELYKIIKKENLKSLN